MGSTLHFLYKIYDSLTTHDVGEGQWEFEQI